MEATGEENIQNQGYPWSPTTDGAGLLRMQHSWDTENWPMPNTEAETEQQRMLLLVLYYQTGKHQATNKVVYF